MNAAQHAAATATEAVMGHAGHLRLFADDAWRQRPLSLCAANQQGGSPHCAISRSRRASRPLQARRHMWGAA